MNRTSSRVGCTIRNRIPSLRAAFPIVGEPGVAVRLLPQFRGPLLLRIMFVIQFHPQCNNLLRLLVFSKTLPLAGMEHEGAQAELPKKARLQAHYPARGRRI